MSDAFRCDRCGNYHDGDGDLLMHPGSDLDNEYEKELCRQCYLGWIEYVTGVPADEVNEWDHMPEVDNAE